MKVPDAKILIYRETKQSSEIIDLKLHIIKAEMNITTELLDKSRNVLT